MQITLINEEVAPKCAHFGICGGCRYQHIPYADQTAQKQAFVKSCFGIDVEPIIPSPLVWGYRNKMEFSFSQAKSGEQFLGLMKRRGRVETLSECHLTSEWFMEVLQSVRIWWQGSGLAAYNPPQNSGLLRTLTLREGQRTKEKMAVLTVSGEAVEELLIESFVQALPQVDTIILRKMITQKKCPTRFEERVLQGRGYIYEELDSLRFRVRAASFFQPNSRQAEVIYQKAIECAELSYGEHVLDLYCGTGALGIFASRHVRSVYGIEIVEEAIEDAKANLAYNKIHNMRVEVGDVGEKLTQCEIEPTTIFVDPPRVGLSMKTIEALLRLRPEKIVYVSCNPLTQVVDCQKLGSYEIEHIQPIDQFPHTPHVENIVRLRRKT